jgi:hypothetical protein
MSLLNLFRRQPPIDRIEPLADFIDQRAAFLIQKGMYDYARARSGHYAKVLFAEPEFREAVEISRWRAYPMGLAMVGEMVEGVLRPHAGDEPRAALDALIEVVLAVFDRYPVPQALGAESWADARDELARKLDQIGLHPPKRVIDIPEPYAKQYFAMMPIHKDLLTRDQPTARAYLRLTLANMHDDLTKRIDAAAIVAELIATRAPET